MPAIYSQIIGGGCVGYSGGRVVESIRGNITIATPDSGFGRRPVPPNGSARQWHALPERALCVSPGLSQIQNCSDRQQSRCRARHDLDLFASTGISTPGSLLSLEAGGDVILQKPSEHPRRRTLVRVRSRPAGILPRPTTSWPASGNITFQGTGAIAARDGSISLLAGKNINRRQRVVRTVNGGSIDVTALFRQRQHRHEGKRLPVPAVEQRGQQRLHDRRRRPRRHQHRRRRQTSNIAAGQDITSILPLGVQTSQSRRRRRRVRRGGGECHAHRGGNISGHYVVRNGTGTINAGQNAGTAARQLALSLVAGGWNVHAGHDSSSRKSAIPTASSIPSAPPVADAAFLRLRARRVRETERGQRRVAARRRRARKSGLFEQGIPSLYAPSLDITAGAGA